MFYTFTYEKAKKKEWKVVKVEIRRTDIIQNWKPVVGGRDVNLPVSSGLIRFDF